MSGIVSRLAETAAEIQTPLDRVRGQRRVWAIVSLEAKTDLLSG